MKNLFNLFVNNQNPNSKSSGLRSRRFSLFLKYLNVDLNTKILDVGGTEGIWHNTGLEKNVTLINIAFSSQREKGFVYVQGDACNMTMFKDKEFDVVFSNSVIEHVGDSSRHKLFSNEIKRVGKKYWVQTPYKHFPVEPHWVFPFFQYMPYKIQKFIALHGQLSYYNIYGCSDKEILEELSRIKLLNKKEMKRLFEDAVIITEKYFGITKSLIAVKGMKWN